MKNPTLMKVSPSFESVDQRFPNPRGTCARKCFAIAAVIFAVLMPLQDAFGQTTRLIAGWDFQTTTSGGTAVAASPNTPTLFNANVGSGALYLNGSEGSSAWLAATELNAFGGT